jgi:hypothetical protein
MSPPRPRPVTRPLTLASKPVTRGTSAATKPMTMGMRVVSKEVSRGLKTTIFSFSNLKLDQLVTYPTGARMGTKSPVGPVIWRRPARVGIRS